MKKYIKGNFRKSIFSNESGFIIGIFKIKETNDEELTNFINKTITFKGYFAELKEDDLYILYGETVNHPKYGFQYQVNEYEKIKPDDREGIIEFLCSDLFRGVGEKIATAIVDRLGDNALEKILEDFECLQLVPKLTYKKAKHVYDTLMKYEESHKTIVYITELGFTMKDALEIYNKYHEQSISTIESNLYKLLDDLENLSFTKLDKIALEQGIEQTDENRMNACIYYCLEKQIYATGDTYISSSQLKYLTEKYLRMEMTEEDAQIYLDSLRFEGKIVTLNDRCYIKKIYDAEENVAKKMSRLLKQTIVVPKKLNQLIQSLEETNEITYGVKQKEAIKEALSSNVCIITGGPGTGKTTLIKAIVDLYISINKISPDSEQEVIALLAPTGRASKRMSESTLMGAMTIHRFLKWNKDNNQFAVNEYNKSTCKLIIVDEVSMIDIELLDNLLKGLHDNIKLIMVGDYNQLASVGPGQVLKDSMDSNNIKVIELDMLYRQSEESYIPVLAQEIKDNIVSENYLQTKNDYTFLPCNNDTVCYNIKKVAEQIYSKNYNYKQVQFMAPMYAGVNGIDSLNKVLQDIFNPKDETKKEIIYGDIIFRENDKVLQLTNVPDLNVYNGDIGIIQSIVPATLSKSKKSEIYIDFDGNIVKYDSKDFAKIKHGFIISIHKSQGSEFEVVVLPICRSYYKMLYRKLIYTAITRAKRKLILIGEPNSFMYAVSNTNEYQRNTSLNEKLNEFCV